MLHCLGIIELQFNGALHNSVGYNVGALGKALYTIVWFLELRCTLRSDSTYSYSPDNRWIYSDCRAREKYPWNANTSRSLSKLS